MNANAVEPGGLNDVQLSLLRMFDRPMSHEESVEIRDLLVSHYSEKLLLEVDRVVTEKGLTEQDYESLRTSH
jgi:hypothetical protein